jgi:hypothetical protein
VARSTQPRGIQVSTEPARSGAERYEKKVSDGGQERERERGRGAGMKEEKEGEEERNDINNLLSSPLYANTHIHGYKNDRQKLASCWKVFLKA